MTGSDSCGKRTWLLSAGLAGAARDGAGLVNALSSPLWSKEADR